MASGVSLAQPQAIRAIFFDVGFTLLAPHPSVVDIVLDVCARRGTPVTRAEVTRALPPAEAFLRRTTRADPWTWGDEAAIAAIWDGYFKTLLRPCLHGASEEGLAACAGDVRIVFDQASSYALYPDVVPALGALKAQTARHLVMGVISDWGVGLGLILRHHDLVRYFDFAVISAQLRRAKPDPALFATALRRADAIGDYAVHIGDSYPLDVLGARAAGITPILLDRRRALDPAALDCLVAHDLYDVLDLLEVPRPAR
ncbi:MAG: HAD-IA family hydrolase [Ktedonobacterales bacterium]|nr:HAD-IA family hydrolase [Ktedonobacterales bacterium]